MKYVGHGFRVAVLTLGLAGSAAATPYHVDCAAGDDNAAGTSPHAAWRTVAKASATTFLPGDSILLRRGTHCAGQLWPKGSGEPGRPIVVGAYGEGTLPVIDGSGADAAIKLFDQSHWVVETLETIGGSPYGVFVSGTTGELRDFTLRSLVVHDVTGEPKSKTSGLVVVYAPDAVRMSDVVIDGVTAYNTTQWAGIVVNGYGETGANRIHNVTVRNSIVHHVAGDGIILFSVEDGLIEWSAAWLTGLEPVQTIGTPNAIWTWTCRRCVVRQTEGFFIDSPGVDGGVYDIDFGNDDNVVEDNYGHDAMGYCVAVFGAERMVTTNSVVRGNVCVDNGRSPKLALRQGDLFVFTWNGGSLDGLRIENNTFYWNPVIEAPAALLGADFSGSRPNVMAGNRIATGVSHPIQSNGAIKLEGNAVSPAVIPNAAPVNLHFPPLRLELTLGDTADRSQIVFLKTALAQYPGQLDVALLTSNAPANLASDWNLGCIRIVARRATPGLRLLTADGVEIAAWRGFVPPKELGFTLRRHFGVPNPFRTTATGTAPRGCR
jgi:hypothetical protein